jgi:hypothetical protein
MGRSSRAAFLMVMAAITPISTLGQGVKAKTLPFGIHPLTALLVQRTPCHAVLAFAAAKRLLRLSRLQTTLVVLEQRQALGIGLKHPIATNLEESLLLRRGELGTLV